MPGGGRGLQNRCGAGLPVLGGFDSHTLPLILWGGGCGFLTTRLAGETENNLALLSFPGIRH